MTTTPRPGVQLPVVGRTGHAYLHRVAVPKAWRCRHPSVLNPFLRPRQVGQVPIPETSRGAQGRLGRLIHMAERGQPIIKEAWARHRRAAAAKTIFGDGDMVEYVLLRAATTGRG